MKLCHLCPTLRARRADYRVTLRHSRAPLYVCKRHRLDVPDRMIETAEQIPMVPEQRDTPEDNAAPVAGEEAVLKL